MAKSITKYLNLYVFVFLFLYNFTNSTARLTLIAIKK